MSINTMNGNNSSAPTPVEPDQFKRLRTTLAVLQGVKLLPRLQLEAEATISHDQTKRITYLATLYSRIHLELFYHWKEQAIITHRPGTMPDADKRREFRKAIASLVFDSENNEGTAIFDNNGFVIYAPDIAERMATFYYKMRHIRPFAYGNRLTLDFFMVALSKLPAVRAVYPHGIDFRRLDARDAAALHHLESNKEDVVIAFRHALDPYRTRGLGNIANAYGVWPDNKKLLSGIPFLSYKTAQGIDCIVTVNGGLIPLDQIDEKLFAGGIHVADVQIGGAKVIGYLPGTEDLHCDKVMEIDGITITDPASAPIFCLDVNITTGLRTPSHMEVIALIKRHLGANATIFDLANNPTLKQTLLAAADKDKLLCRSIEIAYERLSKITAIFDKAIQEIFQGKKPVSHPTLFLSMGGSGVGKTIVEDVARASCGDNFVIASLDEFRKRSKLYQVLTAANHHSDDYVYVEPFANRLRDLVAEHARKHGINILYDGTGIPYSPRYSKIVQQFREAGFKTQIIAVDAFLVKPPGRKGELSRPSVIESVKERFQKIGRALPWVITVNKHIQAPESFLNGLEDPFVEKIALFANDGEMNRYYLVAESFMFSEEEINELRQQEKSGTLAEYFQFLIRARADSTLRNLVGDDEQGFKELIGRNPEFEGANVAYQAYAWSSGYRLLAIYNIGRMIDFLEKRKLNPNASGEEGLLHKADTLAFDVDPLGEEPWRTRLRGAVTRG